MSLRMIRLPWEVEMKKRFVVWFVLMAALFASPAFAQFGSVKGVCKDAQGKPIVGAVVEYRAVGSARVYKLKTDSSGSYSSLGVMYGTYNVSLIQDGQEIFHLNGITIGSEEKPVDIDIQHEREQASKQPTTSPDQSKLSPEQQKLAAAVKALNEKLLAANEALKANDYDSA